MAEDDTFVRRPQRWDVPFWKERANDPSCEVTEKKADELLNIPHFQKMDQSRFAKSSPLRDILMNDARLRSFKPGDIVVRQGRLWEL